MPMPAPPVFFDPSVETIAEDEAETLEQLTATLLRISDVVFADSRHAFRSVHAKSHGIIEGELEILPNLATDLAQGLFAKNSIYPVVMRLSTIAGDMLEDGVSIPRAIAFKVIGVDGDRLAGSETDRTQDFLMADGPVFSAPTAKKFLASLKLLAKTTDKAPGLKKALSSVLRGVEAGLESVGSESATLKTLGGHPNNHILGATFARVDRVEREDGRCRPRPRRPPDGRPQLFRDWRRETWELRAQLCTDLKAMPVEDASVKWPEDLSPYRTVARITATSQDTWSSDKVRRVDDGMSFSPWHGLAAHQPLGSVMRARKETYRASAKFRGERNGCPMHEPRD
jgi:hypothetical protein